MAYKYSPYNWILCHPKKQIPQEKDSPSDPVSARHVFSAHFFVGQTSCFFWGEFGKPTGPRVYLLPSGKTHGPTFRKETTFLKRQKTKARLLGTNPICTNETLEKDDFCLLNCCWLLLLLIFEKHIMFFSKTRFKKHILAIYFTCSSWMWKEKTCRFGRIFLKGWVKPWVYFFDLSWILDPVEQIIPHDFGWHLVSCCVAGKSDGWNMSNFWHCTGTKHHCSLSSCLVLD